MDTKSCYPVLVDDVGQRVRELLREISRGMDMTTYTWLSSSGNVTDEVWKKYIEDQKSEEPDDNFKGV